jgi:hypothetical protein
MQRRDERRGSKVRAGHRAGISRDVEAICTVVALCEPVNVSRLRDLLLAAGLRASAARQFSTQSLRVPLNELVERGLVRTEGALFASAPYFRYRWLRRVARVGRLEPLAKALAEAEFGPGRLSYVYDHGWGRREFEARVALCSGAAHTDAMLQELAQLRSVAEVVRQFAGAASTPVDVVSLNGGVSAIAAGEEHFCALIEENGTVQCWGAAFGNSPTVKEGLVQTSWRLVPVETIPAWLPRAAACCAGA